VLPNLAYRFNALTFAQTITMKFLKIFGIVLGVILLLVIAASLVLPAKTTVARSIEISAKPKNIFKHINDFHQWPLWSPWYKKDTTAAYQYNEITAGSGAKLTWNSNNPEVGKGSMTILQSIPFEKIEIKLEMGWNPSMQYFMLEPSTENNYKLTWSMESDASSLPFYLAPFSKLFNLMLESFVAPDFEAGLSSLKALSEAETELSIGGYEAEIRDFAGLDYLGIRNQLKEAEIGAKLGENYALLSETIVNNAAKQKGAPFTINYSAKNKVYDMETCLGVDAPLSAGFPIVPGKLESGKHLVIKYYGAYEKMGPVYGAGFTFMVNNNLKASGPPIEFYITDPVAEPDTSKWLTELVFPFKD
jgi:effector-binding domain-containing protein/ribosome-associated toxin RatA of RatAB toxin-antitoxin module